MSADRVYERLARQPRVRFAHLPTPLEPLPRLSAELGGPPLWVKRDDCTGLATGGNKTRKLEYLCGAAQEEGLEALVGQTGVARMDLRPSGFATIDGRRVDVVTRGEVIPKDTAIKVIRIELNQVVVAEDS